MKKVLNHHNNNNHMYAINVVYISKLNLVVVSTYTNTLNEHFFKISHFYLIVAFKRLAGNFIAWKLIKSCVKNCKVHLAILKIAHIKWSFNKFLTCPKCMYRGLDFVFFVLTMSIENLICHRPCIFSRLKDGRRKIQYQLLIAMQFVIFSR